MDRRLFLSVIAGTAALPNMLRALPLPPPQPHRLNLANPHTGETFSGIYRDDNGPIPGVMEELSAFLRDFRSGEKIAIDVGVIDFLMGVMQAVGQTRATILSARPGREGAPASRARTYAVCAGLTSTAMRTMR